MIVSNLIRIELNIHLKVNVQVDRVGKADVFYPRAHQEELILFGGHAKKRFAHPTF